MNIKEICSKLLVKEEKIIVDRGNIIVLKGYIGGEKVSIKIYKEKERFEKELECNSILEKYNLPVPAIEKYVEYNKNYILVRKWLEGEASSSKFYLSFDTGKLEFSAQCGSILGRMHNRVELNSEYSFWKSKYYSKDFLNEFNWIEYIKIQFNKWKSRIVYQEDEEALKEKIDIMGTQFNYEHSSNELSFLHGDFIFRNIIVDNNLNVNGMIDFEGCLVGDPYWDLAKITWLDFDNNSKYTNVFLNHWSSEYKKEVYIDYRKLNFYQELQAVAAIAWVDKHNIINNEKKSFRKTAIKKLMNL